MQFAAACIASEYWLILAISASNFFTRYKRIHLLATVVIFLLAMLMF